MSAPLKQASTKHNIGYILGLDGLRAMAILAVLVSHGFEFGEAKLSGVSRLFVLGAEHLGTAGVRLFFAISGYLICTRLANELKSASPASALKAFYIRRAFRIIPPVLPYLLCLVVLNKLSVLKVSPGELLAALVFYSNYWHGKSWFTSHFWTLSVEEHFYLLWAPLLALAGRMKAALIACLVIVLTAIVRPLVIAGLSDYSQILEQSHLQLDSFMLPCLIALFILTPAGFRIAVRLSCSLTFIIAAVGLAVLPPLFDHLQIPVDIRVIESLLFGVIVVVPGMNAKAFVTRLLESPLLRWIGHRSYSVYIWQMLIFVPTDLPLAEKLYRFILHCLFVLPIAELSYRFIEQPAMKIGRSIASSSKLSSSSAPVALSSVSR